MKYYAEVKNGIVLNLAQSEDILDWEGWIEYSPEGEFRGQPAMVGGAYSYEKDLFALPKFYPSWVFNDTLFKWEAPVAKPEGPAAWDEANQVWNTPE